MTTSFRNYILSLGYSNSEIVEYLNDAIFDYPIDEINKVSVKYIDTPTQESIFANHKKLWNKNSDSIFIAVGPSKTQIVNVKQKPVENKHDQIFIESFDYGINSVGYENIVPEKISKVFIDSSFLYEFISSRRVKSEEVDKDLLLNLLALRNDLGENPNAHILILRCLFVKYLEDRGIFDKDYLIDRLKDESPRKLISAFNEIKKINGDVFKFDQLIASEINVKDLKKLAVFFETDYRFGQGTLFPYQFDQIPIQLISHVYESFLKSESKKGSGIYYTPYFLVDFILKQTLTKLVKSKKGCKVLDPAVGSGAFLVESFKIIQKAYGDNVSFEQKKKILETQLFGIDVDKSALQIAAFSLYLALLETETPEFIRDKIEKSSPILPSLIGNNLISGNALINNKIFEGETFDYIVSNPPWGSASENGDEDERLALSGDNIDFPEYKHVADYEKSQAFLVRAKRWSDSNSYCAMVVKNSIFLNRGSLKFRQNLLQTSMIEEFYELSHYNGILFKKRVLGKVGAEKIEIGASEPCAVVIFKPIANGSDYNVKYASPKLPVFAEKFNLIYCNLGDVSVLKNTDFIANDSLWRIMIHGDKEDFELIEKLKLLRIDVSAYCSKGFEPSPKYKPSSDSSVRKLVKSEYFEQYFLFRKPTEFLWDENRLDKLRRPFNDEFYLGDRILIANRPKPSDGLKLRAIFTNQKLIFRNDVFCLKLKHKEYTKPYLALINSSLFGYFLFHESVQWFGGEKRDSLRKFELLNLPFPALDDILIKILSKEVNSIESGNTGVKSKLDNLVFDLYNLLDYEKEIIKEFYQTRVERGDVNLSLITKRDMEQYFDEFKKAFSLILSPKHTLRATYQISSSLGAIICLSIASKNDSTDAIVENNELSLLRLAKSNQLSKVEATKILYEEKVKIYDKDKFYIIKSNQFKDWTVRQAMRDAKEEMELFLKQLPLRNG